MPPGPTQRAVPFRSSSGSKSVPFHCVSLLLREDSEQVAFVERRMRGVSPNPMRRRSGHTIVCAEIVVACLKIGVAWSQASFNTTPTGCRFEKRGHLIGIARPDVSDERPANGPFRSVPVPGQISGNGTVLQNLSGNGGISGSNFLCFKIK